MTVLNKLILCGLIGSALTCMWTATCMLDVLLQKGRLVGKARQGGIVLFVLVVASAVLTFFAAWHGLPLQ